MKTERTGAIGADVQALQESYRAFERLGGAMTNPRVRAAAHVAIEADAVPVDLAMTVLDALAEARSPPRHVASVGVRVRLAHAARARATVLHGLAYSPDDGRMADETARLLQKLLADRDPLVVGIAAGSLGALVPLVPWLAKRLDPQSQNAAEGRRALWASTVRWLLGDLNSDSYFELFTKADSFARAGCLYTAAHWQSSAPSMVLLLVERALQSPTVETALACVELAIRAPSSEPLLVGFAHLPPKIRAELPWLTSPHALAILRDFSALRVAARSSIVNAGPLARALLERAAASEAEVDPVLESVLVTSTLVHDAALASARSVAEGRAVRDLWTSAIVGLRRRSVDRYQERGRQHNNTRRDRLRAFARAVDATPPSIEPEASPSALALLAHVARECDANEADMLDRPLARALSVLLERAGGPTASDMTALLLTLQARVMRHFVASYGDGIAANILRHAVEVRRILDADLGLTARAQATQLVESLRLLAHEASPLAETKVGVGIQLLSVALVELLREDHPTLVAEGTLTEALEALVEGLAQGRRAYGLTVQGGPAPSLIRKTLLSCMRAPIAGAAAKALADVERWLPPILRGAFSFSLANRGVLAAQRSIRPGTVVGDYVATKVLGAGGMGTCLLAKGRVDGTAVVLKVPSQSTRLHLSLFRQEAIALLRLADDPHPGIVRFLSYSDGGGSLPHLVMDVVDGESLEKRIGRRPLPFRDALGIAIRIADALAFAHERGVAHQDLKPANVMMSRRSSPVLVDWGIASDELRVGMGTPFYMAPERLNSRVGDARPSDIFALACIFCEMTSGHVLLGGPLTARDEAIAPGYLAAYEKMAEPYREMMVHDLMVGTESLRLARATDSGVEGTALPLVFTMLASDPARRPSASQVAKDLLRLAGPGAREPRPA